MCGIFGMITRGRPVDVESCYRAVQSLTHRGPDGLGVLQGKLGTGEARFALNPSPGLLRQGSPARPDCFLGHRRLSVIDLAPEAFQPMANEDGRIWVVFNGEIYNFRDLRAELEARGHVFRTDHADTEVLVHGYEEWGAELVGHLRGMFAFAILDLRNGELFLARDRFGEKPLYYSLSAEGVMFASELKALRECPGFDRTISCEALAEYLTHGFIPAPLCIYGTAAKLRASERLTVRLDRPQKAKADTYWEVSFDGVPGTSAEEWTEQFDAELTAAIRLRMISDVPIGALLSGGLDSTMVVRGMSLASDRPVEAFTVGFEEDSHDETPYASRAVERYGLRHHVEVLSPEGVLATLPVIVEHFDEPFADPSAIPTYLISRLARRDVTVCLSGDGGDELLAGYGRYLWMYRISRHLDRLPDILTKLIFRPLAFLWPESLTGKGFWETLVPDARERYLKVLGDGRFAGLMRAKLPCRGGGAFESAWPDTARSLVDKMCVTDSRFYVPEDLMVKVDRASMAVSLESRAPLLDHRLFELVGRMPLGTRFDGVRGKLPFRRTLETELGPAFVNRPKKGFSFPVGQWFKNELRDDLRDALLGSGGILAAVFPRKAIRRLIRMHRLGTRDQGRRLWKLYMLQKWHHAYGGSIGKTGVA